MVTKITIEDVLRFIRIEADEDETQEIYDAVTKIMDGISRASVADVMKRDYVRKVIGKYTLDELQEKLQ